MLITVKDSTLALHEIPYQCKLDLIHLSYDYIHHWVILFKRILLIQFTKKKNIMMIPTYII